MTREVKLWTHSKPTPEIWRGPVIETGEDVCAYKMVGIRRVAGSQSLMYGYRHVFEKLPDCLMVFQSHCTSVRYLEDSRQTVVTAPYMYFFTALVPVTGLEDPLMNTTLSSPSNNGIKMKAIDIECSVNYVMYYNEIGRIERDCFHITITGCSDPSVSQSEIIRYVGLDALPQVV
jgi:hypothetical protein